MSRIASGKLRVDLAPVDLSSVVGAVLETIRGAAEAKEITVATAIDGGIDMVLGDEGRLHQVVWNLISNAIKFTPRGGRVDVALAPKDGSVELSVSDTGPGIDPDFLPLLFERFRQSEASAARQHGGLGLGLAIVKHLVELHGGTVRAESRGKGRGARFTVELPRCPEPHLGAAPVAAPQPVARLARARVLVVDDEPDARELVKRLLEDQGATVVTTESAADALCALADTPLDAMVSDIGMPGTDGYELMRRVRAGNSASDVPAVALTAYARPEDSTRAIAAGFQAHLAKPVEPTELVATVAGVIKRPAVPA